MEREAFKNAIALADQVRYALIATASAEGLPHIASAGSLTQTSETDVVLTDWFCPGTVANLGQNPRVAIVVWDPDTDIGYQLLGTMTSLRDIGMLDGYIAGEEERPFPQAERELHIHVDQIIGFSHAPHTDMRLEQCPVYSEERGGNET